MQNKKEMQVGKCSCVIVKKLIPIRVDLVLVFSERMTSKQDYSFKKDISKDGIKNFKCEICEKAFPPIVTKINIYLIFMAKQMNLFAMDVVNQIQDICKFTSKQMKENKITNVVPGGNSLLKLEI